MINESNTLVNIILSVILFPLLFQNAFLIFAWGASDLLLILLAKRLFLLLPVLAFIACCWMSMAALLTVLFRQNRQQFVIAFFLTWWDLGKSIFSFWGGIFNFVFVFIFSLLGFLKILLFGLWAIIQDILFLPVRLIAGLGRYVMSTSIPWIAVVLTLLWCLVEAVIFTYITTPLVVDVFSNITGQQLTENIARIPLFIFLLFVVLGSYTVMSTFLTYVKSKNIPTIIGICIVELVVIFVEVTFLYREFVDSLVPWFAQYSENFELGIFWTLAIASFFWFGIRSLSWFLFASHGIPPILSIIQGKGLANSREVTYPNNSIFNGFSNFMTKLKQDSEWINTKGEDVLNAFILPPLQIVAATINFCILLITGKHLFDIPFKSTADFTHSKMLLQSISSKQKASQHEPLTVIEDTNIMSKVGRR